MAIRLETPKASDVASPEAMLQYLDRLIRGIEDALNNLNDVVDAGGP